LVDLLQANIGDSPGQPQMYSALARAYPGLIKNILDYKPTGLTAEQQTKYYNDYIARAKGIGGESPYEAYRKQIEGLGNRDTGVEKGAAFLQAGAAMMQPGMNFAQGLGQAGSVLGQQYARIAREDTAAKRAQASMNFNLLDAERKERMGLHRDATSALSQASKDQRAVEAAELTKRKIIADLAARGLTAAKPTGTGGRAAQVKLPERLADAEIDYANDPTEENKRRVEALRSAVAQTRTSDIGPGRQEAALTPSGVSAATAISKNVNGVMMGIIPHPLSGAIRDAKILSRDQDPAKKAEGQKALESLETQVRNDVTKNYPASATGAPTAPTTRPSLDISKVKGLPSGAKLGGLDANGNQIVLNSDGEAIGIIQKGK
jgi:hypothetical protein